MSRLIALSGSMRHASHNTALAHELARLAPDGCEIVVHTPAGIPPYDGDAEAEHGIPDAVARLKDDVVSSDGLVLVTPEYNQGVPGVLKNAIDWMSRPASDIARVFRGRPVAVCGATPGGNGTRAAQSAWLPTLRALGMSMWSERLLFVAGAGRVFDESGQLADDDLRRRTTDFVAGFDAFARARAASP